MSNKIMTDTTQTILAAAATMFARYGYTKTTMADIATEAGVARQTVYNAFPSKEEILRAVVRRESDTTFSEVMAIWADAGTLDEKLNAFQTLGPLKWYDLICAAPDLAELMDGLHKAASEVMVHFDAQWRSEIAKALRNSLDQNPSPMVPPEDIADFFYSTSLNAKHGVKDTEQLRVRLDTIRAATLALLKA